MRNGLLITKKIGIKMKTLMSLDEKRKLKKKAKLFNIWGLIISVLIILQMIMIFSFSKYLINFKIIIICCFVVSIFIDLIVFVRYQIYSDKLRIYMKEINEYRNLIFVNRAIELANNQDYDKAISYFNMTKDHSNPRVFLKGYIIGILLNSNDKKRIEQGEKYLQEVLNILNPDKTDL